LASFIHHEACPKCGSSDAGSRYDNGDLYCFACAATIERGGKITETTTDTTSPTWAPLDGECVALPPRALTKQTCETWQYQVGEIGGRPCHIANFRDARGKLVAQKLRTANKEFPTLGERKNKPLYGVWRFPSGGRYLTVTEGELDALSVSQVFDNKYPSGLAARRCPERSRAGAIERHYEWLDRCERIVLMFDMDDPGQSRQQRRLPRCYRQARSAIAISFRRRTLTRC
jgi:twinkle protein